MLNYAGIVRYSLGDLIDNVKHFRVTEVLKPFSGLNAVDPYVLENAAVRGTKVHAICDAIAAGIDTGKIPEELKGYVDSFEGWAEGKHFLKRPPRMYCNELQITGEIDGIYQSSGINSLFDLKTPSKESRTWALQLSAYHHLARLNGHVIDRIESVRLRKDGSRALTADYDPATHFPIFLSCLNAYKYFHPTRRSNT